MAEINDPFKKAVDNPFDKDKIANPEPWNKNDAPVGNTMTEPSHGTEVDNQGKQNQDPYPTRVSDLVERQNTDYPEGDNPLNVGRSGDVSRDTRVAAYKATLSDNDPAKFDTDPLATPIGGQAQMLKSFATAPNVSAENPTITREQQEQRNKIQEQEEESRRLQVKHEMEAKEKREKTPGMMNPLKTPTVPEETRREIEKILFEYNGMEADIPLGHRYWQLKNERAPGS